MSKNTSPAFGATRNAWDKVYYKERAPPDLTLPGPGAYDQIKLSISKNESKSFRIHPVGPKKQLNITTPGPG